MITPEQLEARRKFIGSSDMSAILGLSPYCNAEDVRLEKTPGKLEEWKGNAATDAGTYLEPTIIQWAQDRLKVQLTRDQMYVHPNGIMCANMDGETPDGEPVEAKTSGIVGPIFGNWGREYSDEVPEQYIIQVTHQLACHPKKPRRGYLAALLGGRGFNLYIIERSDELIAALEEKATHFWNEYVLKGQPAPNVLPSIEVARRIKRQPGLITPVDADVCDAVAAAIAARKEAERLEEVAKRRLLAIADGADAIRRGMDGDVIFTNTPNKNGVRSLKLKDSKGRAA